MEVCCRKEWWEVINSNLTSNQSRNGVLAFPSSNDRRIPSKKTNKLFIKEMDERRQKDLCFCCDVCSVVEV